MVKFFKDMCEVLNIYAHTQDLEILSARLYYGVKDELIPLVVGIKRLGRKRARALVGVFGTDLSNIPREDLLKVEGIGPKIADAIVRSYQDKLV
jgi:helicase